jgi:hypothetical protein
MNITTAGLPASELEAKSLPETVSGKLKLGMGVPSSRMLDGTAMLRLVPRLGDAGNLSR